MEKKQVSFTYLPSPNKIDQGILPEPKEARFASINEFLDVAKSETFERTIGKDARILQASIGRERVTPHTVGDMVALAVQENSLDFQWDGFKKPLYSSVMKAFQKGTPFSDIDLGNVTVGNMRYEVSVNSLEFIENERYFYLHPQTGRETPDGKNVEVSEVAGVGLPVNMFAGMSFEQFQTSMEKLMTDHIHKHNLEETAERKSQIWKKYDATRVLQSAR